MALDKVKRVGDLVVQKTSQTGSVNMSAGNTAQRNLSPIAGDTRINLETKELEFFDGTAWNSAGGATGGGSNKTFFENDKIITSSYTITDGKNAMSAGPIDIVDNIYVDIPDGSAWVIV